MVQALTRGKPGGGTFHIEDVQDHVELALMRSGEHEVARAYVLYRERRSQERAAKGESSHAPASSLHVTDAGHSMPLDMDDLSAVIASACEGLHEVVSVEAVLQETVKNLYDGVPLDEVYKSAILSARSLIALIEPGSCFVGTLLELALAADRSYMRAGMHDGSNEALATVGLSAMNFGPLPM